MYRQIDLLDIIDTVEESARNLLGALAIMQYADDAGPCCTDCGREARDAAEYVAQTTLYNAIQALKQLDANLQEALAAQREIEGKVIA